MMLVPMIVDAMCVCVPGLVWMSFAVILTWLWTRLLGLHVWQYADEDV